MSIGNRNPIKEARRNALQNILESRWGYVETEKRIPGIAVPDFKNPSSINPMLKEVLKNIQATRNREVQGKKDFQLPFDYYLPAVGVLIEFDETQHFTSLRAVALRSYPLQTKIGFDKSRWIALAGKIQAKDNFPLYRDEQRAFYDSVRDIMAPFLGFKPVVRIFQDDVRWEEGDTTSANAKSVLSKIEELSRA